MASDELEKQLNMPPIPTTPDLQQLIRHAQQLQGLLAAATDAVVVMDAEGRVTEWNAAAERMLGFRADEAIGNDLASLIIPPEHRDAHHRGLKRYLATRTSTMLDQALEVQAVHRNGVRLFVDLSVWAASKDGGLPVFGAFLRDVTQRKAQQQALAHAAERYRQVVENLGEGMGVIQDGVTVYINPRAAELLVRSPESMLGCSFLDWVHPEDRPLVAERQVRRQRGEPVPDLYDLRCVTGTGEVRWMSTRASSLQWEGRPATMTFFTDVTEQRKMLQALQASETRYRTVVDQLGEGMMVIRGGRVVFANAQAAGLLGRTPDALLGLPAVELIHADDRASVSQRMQARERGEQVDVHSEFRIVHPDGTTRWLTTHSSTSNWEGAPATLTFFSDHTEQRQMLDALHRSEERYRMVVEHVGDGMVVVQGEQFVFANQRAAQIVEMTVPDMLAHGYLHRIHPEDHDMIQERRRRRLAGETVPNRYEIRLRMEDGRIKWLDIGVTLVPWDGGMATLTFFSDVSERKALEHRLTQTLAERETILNTSVVGIAFLTAEGRFRWANPAMLTLFGADAGRPLMSMEVVYLNRAQYLEVGGAVAQAISQGGRYQTELQMRRLDGRLIWVSLSGQAVNRSELTAGTVWTVLDITQRKQAEEDTRKALQQQRELNDLRSRFVSMTSHEFRTPLATILSSAELLRFYGDRMNSNERNDVLTSIESSVHRMTQMLDRVLMLGRSESGLMEFKPKWVDLVVLCTEVCNEARQALASPVHAVSLTTATPAMEGWFDEKLLRHVLGNLVSNAIKYSPAGGNVEVGIELADDQIKLSVADQGIGIPNDEIPHLFTSFHRASNVGDIKGTGLGLAIVKNAIETHGGRIAVHSVPNQGTRFVLQLPWFRDPQAAPKGPTSSSEQP